MPNVEEMTELERLRLEMGFTQEEMSKRLGCSTSHISHIECGQVSPSESMLRLARVIRKQVGNHNPNLLPVSSRGRRKGEIPYSKDALKKSGKALARAREKAGMSQSGLEEATGFKVSAISRMENGHLRITPASAAKFARALGVKAASLLPKPMKK